MNLSHLDLSDRISNAIAALSLIASGGALIYARTQAKAAKEANAAADRANEIAAASNLLAAEANRTSEHALLVSQNQLDVELQAQHAANEPTFEVVEAVRQLEGEYFAQILLRQTGGAPLERVEIKVSGEDVRGPRTSCYADAYMPQPIVWREPSRGTEHRLCVELEYHCASPARVRIDLASFGSGPGQSWTTHLNAQTIEVSEQEPRRSRRFDRP
ncbi:hypothetical protein OHA46_33985 (plasmid) [Streptomyces sp. NBC_00708]